MLQKNDVFSTRSLRPCEKGFKSGEIRLLTEALFRPLGWSRAILSSNLPSTSTRFFPSRLTCCPFLPSLPLSPCPPLSFFIYIASRDHWFLEIVLENQWLCFQEKATWINLVFPDALPHGTLDAVSHAACIDAHVT